MMKQRATAGLALLTVLLLLPALSVSEKNPHQLQVKGSAGFIENKGQIVDQDFRPNSSVLYLLNMPGMNVQLRREGFGYDLYSPSPVTSPIVEGSQGLGFHRIDFNLIDADPDCAIIRPEPSADYRNYYTAGTPTGGVKEVRSYRQVMFKNIYPNIDLEFLAGEGSGFKYNFIISPGGKLEDIRFQINGPEIEVTAGGSLILSTSAGRIEEEIPLSFMIKDGIREPVKVRFVRIRENLYGVEADPAVSISSALIIDPTPRRLWGTYYGGTNSDIAGDVTMDVFGNLYFCGYTLSTGNIATAGSYQTTIKGFYDSFLVRFDPGGQRIWGTYFGGLSMEAFEACTCDKHGNVYLAGRTSSNSFIATPGSHQEVYGGGLHDNYLAKFNSSGQLIWATYYGGSDTEGQVECTTDDSLNVYLCGFTASSDNISTPGTHQPVNNGNEDAYLVRFDSNGVRSWGTFYGGEDDDQGYSCMASQDGGIYVTGKTLSETGISTPGSHQPLHAGAGDAYLVKFTSAGQRLWGTYFGGLNTDESHGVAIDTNNNVYFAGYTSSAENISTPGCQQLNYAGMGDGFITRFNPNGGRQWGTYCGGFLQETVSKRVLSVDDSCFVFFSGATISTDSIATDSAFQPTINGGFDSFLVKYNDQGIRVWGTYYGGPAQDDGVASVSDNCGHQYLLGNTASLSGISTPGTQQPAYGGGSQDTFLAKLTDCIPPDTAGQISGPVSVCANSTNITYTIPAIPRATDYIWSLPSGFTIITGANTHSIAVNVAGNAVSGIISVYGTSCCDDGIPSSIAVTVNPRPVPGIFGTDTICEGAGAFFYTESGHSSYQWMISPGGTILSGGGTGDTSATVTWSVTGPQWISVNYTNATACNALTPSVMDVQVSAGIPVDVTISASQNPICEGIPITFTATPTNGGTSPTYQWHVNGINTGPNSPLFTYMPSNNDQVFCTLTSSEPCTSNNPASSIQHQVSVLEAPEVTFIPCFDTITATNEKPILLRGGIPLGGTFSGTGVSFRSFGSSGSSGYCFDPAIAGPGTHELTYNYTNEAGCEDSAITTVFNFQFSIFHCGDSLTDIRDGQKYPTLQIGTQCWMAANLDYGNEIPFSTVQRDNCIPEKYILHPSPVTSHSFYQWDELMNHQEAEEIQDLCPPGWHVPSENDWNILFSHYTNNAFAGAALKSTGYSGFNALLNGTVFFNRDWYLQDFATFFWSSTSHGPYKAWAHAMNEYNYSVSLYPAFRANAFSVRCLMD